MNLKPMILGLALASTASLCLAQVVIPEGTKVRVRLEQTLSSATAEQGQPVQLAVADDVKVGDIVVVPQGATAVGTIVEAVPKRRMGRTGKLDFSIERVVAADGESIPLRYSITKKEGGSHAARAGALTAGAAIIFWPAAPVFLLMKGKDVTVNKGVAVDVFTDQKHMLNPKLASSTAAGAALANHEAVAATASAVSLKVTSEPNGAEVELDGAFVGSTPAMLPVQAGTHNITVRRGKLPEWRRSLNIQPGSAITVNAVLTDK